MAIKFRVLMVEDSHEQALLVTEFLKPNPEFELDWASDLMSMWDFLGRKSYDVILMDYRLPDGTGLDALAELPKRGYRIPVIMVTGQGDERVAAMTIQRGASDYVVKSGDYFTKIPGLIKQVKKDFELQLALESSMEKVRYQAILLDKVSDAVIVWDIGGHITFRNTAANELFGWQNDKNLGATVSNDYFPRFSPPLDWKKLEERGNDETECCLIGKDRQEFWVSSRITCIKDETEEKQTIGYMDVLRDITERKKAEAELRKLSTAVEQTADSVIITNKDGIVEYVNPAYLEMTGYVRDEVIGKSLEIIRDNQLEEGFEKKFWQTINSGLPFRDEFIRKKKNGQEYYCEEVITSVKDNAGSIVHLILSARDMTERRHMEAQIQAAMTQLTLSARLSAIGELASGIAHRIYNPLTTIIADTQLLRRDLPGDHPLYETIDDMEKSGWKAQEAIHQLLEFSKPASNVFEVISVNDTVQAALGLVGAQIHASGINLEVRLASDLPSILGNSRQVEDLWVNLLLLAQDATIDGSDHSITISSAPGPLPETVMVEVMDDGKRIPSDQIEKIFDVHMTGSNIGRGTGMELTICREIVRQYKGKISVKSNHKSTTFVVVLPALVVDHNVFLSPGSITEAGDSHL
jgi:two-component system cell cycle sensor histidine kinase/response regulator CckA